MTGYDIYNSALIKLGYENSKQTVNNDTAFKKIALDAINEMASDICDASPIKSFADELDIDKKAFSVISYGVAMILSIYNHDTEKNVIMTAIYNAARSAYLSKSDSVTDVFPTIYGV